MDIDVQVAIREDGERIVLDLQGIDVGRAIGKKGQTLDALQFLSNKIVNRFPAGRRHVILDSGDFRERHDEGLVSMARREAKRALQQGKVITLEPMSPRDRRVIHRLAGQRSLLQQLLAAVEQAFGGVELLLIAGDVGLRLDDGFRNGRRGARALDCTLA